MEDRQHDGLELLCVEFARWAGQVAAPEDANGTVFCLTREPRGDLRGETARLKFYAVGDFIETA